MSDVFAMPIDFAPGAETLETLVHSTDFYHVVIGLDPIGTFLEVTGLSVESPVFTYEELGRNRSPVQLPWEGARKGGEVTLAWGTIIRSRFWNWFQAQTPFFMERQPVFILHLSRRNIPLRVFVLWDAWPKGWSYSDLGNNEVTVEKVTLVYDRMFMLDTALLALMPELTNSIPDTDSMEEVDPAYRKPPESPEYTGTELLRPTWELKDETPSITWTPIPQAASKKHKVKPAPKAAAELAAYEALDENYKGKAGEFAPVPLDEDYQGIVGTWATEALPEDYMGLAGAWVGVDGKKVYGKAAGGAGGGAGDGGGSGGGGGAASGDGKAVEDEEG